MKKPTFLEKLPQARFLVEAGVTPGCAAKLVRAGYTGVESLSRASRDDLLSIRGVSKGTLKHLEEFLGHPLRSPVADWRERGLSPKCAKILARAGIESVDALGKMPREEIRNLGLDSVGRSWCEKLIHQDEHSPAEREPVPGVPEATLSQLHAEIAAQHRRLLEVLMPLQGRRGSSPGAALERLRLALWNATRELDSVLSESPVRLDLTKGDEATQKALYSYVLDAYFSPRLLDDPGTIHVPAHTPEECQLRVFYEYGRWFATWIKLEEDMNRPEMMTRELLVFETGEDNRLCIREV